MQVLAFGEAISSESVDFRFRIIDVDCITPDTFCWLTHNWLALPRTGTDADPILYILYLNMHYVGAWIRKVYVGKTLQFVATRSTVSISWVVDLQKIIHVEMHDGGYEGKYAEDEPDDETWNIRTLTLEGYNRGGGVPGTGSSSNVWIAVRGIRLIL